MSNWVQNEIILRTPPEVTEIGEPETVDSGLSISDLI